MVFTVGFIPNNAPTRPVAAASISFHVTACDNLYLPHCWPSDWGCVFLYSERNESIRDRTGSTRYPQVDFYIETYNGVSILRNSNYFPVCSLCRCLFFSFDRTS